MKILKKQMTALAIILIISMALIPTISRAGMESKPGGTLWSNISVSDAYQQCYDLRNPDSTLGNNTLDPHLTLNRDWGAVAYLGLSVYGAVRTASGPNVIISGGTYTTTTGNKTGVLNFGTHYVLTSSFIVDNTATTPAQYRENLIKNKDTKYVELLSQTNTVENTKGQAFAETSGWYSSYVQYPSTTYPDPIRTGIIGFGAAGVIPNSSWAPDVDDSFRAVIWN